jgi:hypothetical protein
MEQLRIFFSYLNYYSYSFKLFLIAIFFYRILFLYKFVGDKDNEILFDYDVNALYPSVMKNNLMPVGKPVPFLGNIRNIEPDAFKNKLSPVY